MEGDGSTIHGGQAAGRSQRASSGGNTGSSIDAVSYRSSERPLA
jgi:hypothetical protein